MKKIIFITGAGRSGTNLLAGIYNDHPKLNVFPGEFDFYNVLTKYNSSLCDISGYENKKYFINYFLKRFKKKNNIIFKKQFLNKNKNLSIVELIEYFSEFFFYNKKDVMINTCNENIEYFLKNFKNCKIIHMLRNPLTQLNSRYLLRHGDSSKRYYNTEFSDSFFRSYVTFEQAYKFKNNKNIKIIKLENLIENQNKSINEINKFLNLKKNKNKISLSRYGGAFISTINGKYQQTNKIVKIKPDFSCLLPFDLYCCSKIKFAKYFYKIKKYENAKPSFLSFFLRHYGLIGKNRKVTYNIINIIKLFFYTIKNYIDDTQIKNHFLKFYKNT